MTYRINEASFSRIVKQMKEKDFALLTGFRDNFSTKQNRERNKELISKYLRPHKIGPVLVKGSWHEEQEDGSKKLVSEDSLFFSRPDSMNQREFRKLILEIIKKYNQDGAVLSLDGTVNIIDQGNKLTKIGDNVSLNKSMLSGAFTRFKNKNFIFEGACKPSSHIQALLFDNLGIKY